MKIICRRGMRDCQPSMRSISSKTVHKEADTGTAWFLSFPQISDGHGYV